MPVCSFYFPLKLLIYIGLAVRPAQPESKTETANKTRAELPDRLPFELKQMLFVIKIFYA